MAKVLEYAKTVGQDEEDQELQNDIATAIKWLNDERKKDPSSKENDHQELIYELFQHYPVEALTPKIEESLTVISHAYGLLLYHYRKRDQYFENIEVFKVRYACPHTDIIFCELYYSNVLQTKNCPNNLAIYF